MKIKLKRLMSGHWKYNERILILLKTKKKKRAIAKFYYIEAFQHGYKHGKNDK